MRTIKHPAFLLLLILLLACRSARQLPSRQTADNVLLPYGPAWGALWQQRAAEYRALCFQAYNTAAMRLDEFLLQSTAKPPAIVTDIDETVLDNSPFTVHTALAREAYSDSAWQRWTAKAVCDTVPGALSFLKYAAAKGVQVFYITNRATPERAATLQNLQHWGFPNADDGHLLLKTAGSGKEARRRQVLQTHDIIMLLGDNLSDFSEIFDKQPYLHREQLANSNGAVFGRRFIVLPNAMYGDWQSALYDYKHQLSPQQQDSILKSLLENY
jgi:5'-nucleotidase (lipoprotein e(P4) family)